MKDLNWGELALRWLEEMAPGGILLTDSELRIRGWNRWLEVHTGIRAADAIGERLFDLYPDIEKRGLDRYFQMALSGQIAVLAQRFHGYLLPMPSPMGTSGAEHMQQTAQIAPLIHEGQVVGTATLITDVTERIAREQILQRQLQQLMTINLVAQAVSSTLDLPTLYARIRERIADVLPCDAFAVALSASPGEPLHTAYAWGKPAIWPGSQAAQAEAARLGEGRMVQAEQSAAEDAPSDDTFLASALYIPLKTPTGVIGVLQIGSTQVSAYHESDIALLESIGGFIAPAILNANLHARLAAREEELRNLIATAPDIIWTLSPDGRILSLNPAFETITGWSADEWMGKPLADLVIHDDRPTVEMMLRDAEKGPAYRAYEIRIRRKDEQHVVAEFSASRQVSPGDEPRLVAIARDVGERKRLEEQLRESQRLESIGRLAGGIAHDFNNILTAITGYAMFVKEALPPGHPSHADIQQVLQGAERAARLTQQLLAYSRKQVLSPQLLDLNKVLIHMEGALRHLAGPGVMLEIHTAPWPAFVRVDPVQMEQVMSHLVTNARDAMPRGGQLTISIEHATVGEDRPPRLGDLAPGRYVRLTVADTGVGMTDEVKAKVFEPFFTTKGVGKGTGLGLATVYGIIKQHGGAVDFWSEPGQGTAFYIYLREEVEAAELAAAPAAPRAMPKGGETILVVDDEPLVRDMIRRALMHAGYVVLEASDGAEAMRLAETYKGDIHLLITDVIMPRVNGRLLSIHLAQLRPGMKTLFMSGYSEDVLGEGQRLGRNEAFIQKPFSTVTLARAVRELLDLPSPGA